MYDYIIEKPELNEDTLTHYGIKGMKWKKRKGTIKSYAKNTKSRVSKILEGLKPTTTVTITDAQTGKKRTVDPNQKGDPEIQAAMQKAHEEYLAEKKKKKKK